MTRVDQFQLYKWRVLTNNMDRVDAMIDKLQVFLTGGAFQNDPHFRAFLGFIQRHVIQNHHWKKRFEDAQLQSINEIKLAITQRRSGSWQLLINDTIEPLPFESSQFNNCTVTLNKTSKNVITVTVKPNNGTSSVSNSVSSSVPTFSRTTQPRPRPQTLQDLRDEKEAQEMYDEMTRDKFGW